MSGYAGYTLGEIRELLEWDWVQTELGEVLHHVAWIDCPDRDGRVGVYGTTTCNTRPQPLLVPGLLSRMGARRCKRCCRKLGVPEGVGSPKNDEALRPWVEARLEQQGMAGP